MQVRVVLRVNNDVHCNLAALVTVNDSALTQPDAAPAATADVPHARFERFAFLPGLSVAHPAIVWDARSQLYWMVSNVNRNALRAWDAAAEAAPYAPAVLALLQC